MATGVQVDLELTTFLILDSYLATQCPAYAVAHSNLTLGGGAYEEVWYGACDLGYETSGSELEYFSTECDPTGSWQPQYTCTGTKHMLIRPYCSSKCSIAFGPNTARWIWKDDFILPPAGGNYSVFG